MWYNYINFKVLKTLSKRIAVIAFIGDKPFGALFRSASIIAWNIDCIKGLFGQLYFRRGCQGKDASQRNTLAVDHHHPLRSFAFFGFPDASAPFFAGAKLPSIKASSQSSNPSASSMDKNLRHTSSHTPWSSRRRSRLQQVPDWDIDPVNLATEHRCAEPIVCLPRPFGCLWRAVLLLDWPWALEAVVSTVSIAHHL
jgi:hypothetical protein